MLHALANDMSDVIRKTSTTANGGKEAKVVTYEDLLKDPEVMESMKKSLGLFVFYCIFNCRRTVLGNTLSVRTSGTSQN